MVPTSCSVAPRKCHLPCPRNIQEGMTLPLTPAQAGTDIFPSSNYRKILATIPEDSTFPLWEGR